ncbi:hypothetical protein ACFRAQ_21370 [Nocardia sp. NPDC056611]|uniref:hypothetical protein n=1 Tax=Nocardia sp. NPDC056611 TaxID=3345877 RepID=UPI003671D83D
MPIDIREFMRRNPYPGRVIGFRSDGVTIELNHQFTPVAFTTADPLVEAWDAVDPRYRVAAAGITFDSGVAVAREVSGRVG